MNVYNLPSSRAATQALEALSTVDESDKQRKRTFARFERFCQANSFHALPTDSMTVRLWFHTHRDEWSEATMSMYRTHINNTHRLAGYQPPCDEETSRYITNANEGKKEQEQVRAAMLDDVISMVTEEPCDDYHQDEAVRLQLDAYLMVGALSALRHQDLKRLRLENVHVTTAGVQVAIPLSKHQPEGFDIHLPHAEPGVPCTPGSPCADACPVALLQRHIAYQRQQGRTTGPLFTARRSSTHYQQRQASKDVAARWAAVLGDPDKVSTRSLRVGAATTARANGMPLTEIQKDLLRHKSLDTTLLYLRNLRIRGIAVTL